MTVTYELRDRVAIITIDDGKANIVTHDIAAALSHSLNKAESEASTVVLAGRPGRFSAGFDLSVMTSGTEAARGLLKAGADVALQIHGLRIPVVIASTGHALAMGAILLLAADIRVGAEGNYKIGLNEVAIGMPVPRFAIALARATLATTSLNAAINLATIYNPTGAVSAGYYDEVVAEDAVLDTAIAHATDFAERLRAEPFALTRQYLRGAQLKAMYADLQIDLTTFTVDLPTD